VQLSTCVTKVSVSSPEQLFLVKHVLLFSQDVLARTSLLQYKESNVTYHEIKVSDTHENTYEGKNKDLRTVQYFKQRLLKFSE